MHHVLVGHVRVGEHNLLDVVLADEIFELGLRANRNAVRIELTGQQRGVDAPCDVRDLRRREGEHVVLLAAAVDDVEIVEVPPGRTRDDNSSSRHVYELCIHPSDRAM